MVVQIKREWTTDGKGNVQTITVPLTVEKLASLVKELKHVPSFFELERWEHGPDGLMFFFKRPSHVGKE